MSASVGQANYKPVIYRMSSTKFVGGEIALARPENVPPGQCVLRLIDTWLLASGLRYIPFSAYPTVAKNATVQYARYRIAYTLDIGFSITVGNGFNPVGGPSC